MWHARLNGARYTTLLICVFAFFTFYIKIKARSQYNIRDSLRGSLLLSAFTLFRINGMFSLCPLNNNKTFCSSGGTARSNNPRTSARTINQLMSHDDWKKIAKQVKIMIRTCLTEKKPYIQSTSGGTMFSFKVICAWYKFPNLEFRLNSPGASFIVSACVPGVCHISWCIKTYSCICAYGSSIERN